ncbi:MAG: methyltransferase domain-containing protein [Pseudomonadota bacterium]
MKSQQAEHINEYDDVTVKMLELIWGEGFMAPGGSQLVHRVFDGVEIAGKRILDIGCGLGGADIILAREFGAEIVAIDLEQPLIDRARKSIEQAGFDHLVECRHVLPGPLDFASASFDIVFSIGAFTQTPDKPQLFAEVYRVLKKTGHVLSYDWTKSPGPLSDDMKTWIKLEELTYEMQTIDDQCHDLYNVGFRDVEGRDDEGWYAEASSKELDLLRGPLHNQLDELFGSQQAEHFIANWIALERVLNERALLPAFFKGQKPA